MLEKEMLEKEMLHVVHQPLALREEGINDRRGEASAELACVSGYQINANSGRGSTISDTGGLGIRCFYCRKEQNIGLV